MSSELRSPAEIADLMMSAASEYGEGRFDSAVSLAVQVLEQKPSHVGAKALLGIVAAQQGRPDEAIRLLLEVVRRPPASHHAHYWLASALRQVGDKNQALSVARQAAALADSDAQARRLVGLCSMDVDDWHSAAHHLERAAQLAPSDAPIRNDLACVYERLNRRLDAKRELRRSLALDPANITALERFGQFLIQDSDFDGVARCGSRILELNPDSASGRLLLAVSLVGRNRPAEAAEHAAKAAELDPDNPEVLSLLGVILQSLGRMDEADSCLRRSVEIAPSQGFAYYAIVRSKPIGAEDLKLVDQMEAALIDPTLGKQYRMELEYALGKAKADLGQFGSSMDHYDSAHSVALEMRPDGQEFDRRAYAHATDLTAAIFDRTCLGKYCLSGLPDETPVFVVGMIRSGTTLIEQMLSNHSMVGGAGEQRFWIERQDQAVDYQGRRLNVDRLKSLGADYLERLRAIAPGAQRIVDKMPGNYLYLGLIHLALPEARIVHVKRNPLDTCLSIWTTPNSAPLSWAHDKDDIVFVYREYLRIMNHWRQVIPADRLLEIEYEEVVSDAETPLRRIVAHCGLEWEDGCLRPEENDRAVSTPSAWQVRQPVYTTSVDRWRPFEPWLGAFRGIGES